MIDECALANNAFRRVKLASLLLSKIADDKRQNAKEAASSMQSQSSAPTKELATAQQSLHLLSVRSAYEILTLFLQICEQHGYGGALVRAIKKNTYMFKILLPYDVLLLQNVEPHKETSDLDEDAFTPYPVPGHHLAAMSNEEIHNEITGKPDIKTEVIRSIVTLCYVYGTSIQLDKCNAFLSSVLKKAQPEEFAKLIESATPDISTLSLDASPSPGSVSGSSKKKGKGKNKEKALANAMLYVIDDSDRASTEKKLEKTLQILRHPSHTMWVTTSRRTGYKLGSVYVKAIDGCTGMPLADAEWRDENTIHDLLKTQKLNRFFHAYDGGTSVFLRDDMHLAKFTTVSGPASQTYTEASIDGEKYLMPVDFLVSRFDADVQSVRRIVPYFHRFRLFHLTVHVFDSFHVELLPAKLKEHELSILKSAGVAASTPRDSNDAQSELVLRLKVLKDNFKEPKRRIYPQLIRDAPCRYGRNASGERFSEPM